MVRWAAAVRTVVGAVGVVVLVGGLAAVAVGEPVAGLWALVSGGVLLAVALFEVGRYGTKADTTAQANGFQPTDEVFDDPTTGARMRVWFDARTGARRYEPDR